MLNKYYSLLIVLIPLITLSQKKVIDIGKLKTEKYPTIEGQLWVRDPNGIDLNSVQFYENQKPVSVDFSEKMLNDSIPKNKAILFLVSKSKDRREFLWYQKILKKIISSSSFKSGDKIAILGYYQENSRIGFKFDSKDVYFMEKAEDVYAKIDSLSYGSKNRLYQNQFHLAVNKALSLLEKNTLSLPKGIIVLSNDNITNPIFQGENPVQRSRRLDVPIYNIQYNTNHKRFESKDLCKQTFGGFYSIKNNNLDSCNIKLQEYLSSFLERHSGLVYSFNYKSSFGKDGLSHTVKVNTLTEQTAFIITSPNKSFSELIQENLILSIIVVVLLILILILLIVFILKKKKQRKLKELEHQAHLSDLAKIQEESDRKIANQQSELKQIQKKRLEEKQIQEKEKQIKLQEEQDALQFQKMLERGNLPWFEYKIGSENGSYQIVSPRLSVGRDKSSDWVVPHPTISRKHFEIVFKDYVYIIKDLDSSNGVVVNGHKITQTEIRHGDVIQVGELNLTFHI